MYLRDLGNLCSSAASINFSTPFHAASSAANNRRNAVLN